MKTPEEIESILNEYNEEHLMQPLVDQSALALYQALRSANPWLPEAAKVLASREMELAWSANGLASLTITVAVDLPGELIKAMIQE